MGRFPHGLVVDARDRGWRNGTKAWRYQLQEEQGQGQAGRDEHAGPGSRARDATCTSGTLSVSVAGAVTPNELDDRQHPLQGQAGARRGLVGSTVIG